MHENYFTLLTTCDVVSIHMGSPSQVRSEGLQNHSWALTISLIPAILYKNLCKTDFHLFLLWIRQGKWPTERNNKNLSAQISQPQSDLNSFFIVHSQHEFAVVTLIVEKWAKSTRGKGEDDFGDLWKTWQPFPLLLRHWWWRLQQIRRSISRGRRFRGSFPPYPLHNRWLDGGTATYCPPGGRGIIDAHQWTCRGEPNGR